MPLLRLLSASILGLVCILGASAQTPTAPPPPASIRIPPLSSTPPLFAVPPAVVIPTTVILSATVDTPCYAIRSYRFTARDLQSSAPAPSSHSTCTPTTPHQFKNTTVKLVK